MDQTKLTPAVLASLDSQLTVLLPSVVPPTLGAVPPQLRETFPIWTLAAEPDGSSGDLSLWTKSTGQSYHQIVAGNVAVASATSTLPESGSRSTNVTVHQVAGPELATQVKDAIDWIDANIPGTQSPRLLSIPNRHLTCIWLIDSASSTNNRVVICSMPPGRGEMNFTIHKAYKEQDFVASLQAMQPIQGLSL